MDETGRFAGLVEEFCRWVEASPDTPERELACAQRYCARLYAGALDLPEGTPEQDDADQLLGGLDYQGAHRRFSVLPINMYGFADPLVVPPEGALVGDVADDLADAYLDLCRGLRLYRAGRTAGAIWEWSFNFRAHWGAHISSALVALHAAATR